jgi:superfamily II DNA or RNA helicase
MTRDERQEICLQKVKDNNYIAGIQAYTGFGKSRVGLSIIKSYQPKSLLITVPTTKLKEDWEYHLSSNNLKGDVFVINTAHKLKKSYDMVLLDEVHRYGSPLHSQIFDNIKYNKLIWFTATLERNDGNHTLILKRAPKVDKITLEEGLNNSWVDPFEVIKIPIELTEDERVQLEKLNKKYESIKKQLGRGNPMVNAAFYICYLDRNKWSRGKATNKVYFNSTIRKKLKGEYTDTEFKKILKKYFIYPDKEDPFYKKAVLAKKFYNVVADRKKLLYNAKNKLSKTVELFYEYEDLYKFIFSQRIEFLEELYKRLPKDKVRIFHSKMKKKERDRAFNIFNEDNSKINTLLSAKSLIEGVDIPKLSVSIITSFTSSQIDNTQIMGRTIRKYKNKRAIIIYLYCPKTQEEVWLNKLNLTNNE